jgi:2-haloacid dehalogenase
MLGAVVRNAGLADLLDHVISVDRVRHYKTHPEAYALGVHATGLKASPRKSPSSAATAGTRWPPPGTATRTLWVNRTGRALRGARHRSPPAPASSLDDVLGIFAPVTAPG